MVKKNSTKIPRRSQEIKKGIASSIDGSWAVYTGKMAECKKKFSEESVHDFRVSIRRFYTLLEVVGNFFDSPYLHEIKPLLKKKLKMFSPLRDTQVMVLSVQEIRHQYPELNLFFYDLLKKEEVFIEEIRNSVKRLNPNEAEGIVFFLKLDFKNKCDINVLTTRNLKKLIGNTFDNIRALLKEVDSLHPSTIHRVRLAFKRFRYMVEHLREVLRIEEEYLKELKDIQTIMGLIQDNEVLYTNIRKFAEQQREIPTRAFREALDHVTKEGYELIDRFMNRTDEIYHLWPVSKNTEKSRD